MPRLNIALRVPPRDLLTLSDCILECVTSDSNNAVGSLYATAYQLIRHDSNEHSTVYRASIGDRSVVLKCCLSDQHLSDLEREATAYQSALLELQGTVVPHFYGFYKGSLGNGRPMGCIVLEDCGDRLDQCFESLPWDDRYGPNVVLNSESFCTLICLGDRSVRSSVRCTFMGTIPMISPNAMLFIKTETTVLLTSISSHSTSVAGTAIGDCISTCLEYGSLIANSCEIGVRKWNSGQ